MSKAKYTEEFEVFWKAYPQKKGKNMAERWWLKYKPDLSNVLGALELQKEEKRWLESKKMFVPCWPYGSTWVHEKRWTDGFCIEFEKHLEKIRATKEKLQKKRDAIRQQFSTRILEANENELREVYRNNMLSTGYRESLSPVRFLIDELRPEIAKQGVKK